MIGKQNINHSDTFCVFTLFRSFEPIGVHEMAAMTVMTMRVNPATSERPKTLASSPTISATVIPTFAVHSISLFEPHLLFLLHDYSLWAGSGQTLQRRRLLRRLRRIQCHEATQSLRYIQHFLQFEFASDSDSSHHVQCTRKRRHPRKQKYPRVHVPTSLQRTPHHLQTTPQRSKVSSPV